jgi:hypothetical protein
MERKGMAIVSTRGEMALRHELRSRLWMQTAYESLQRAAIRTGREAAKCLMVAENEMAESKAEITLMELVWDGKHKGCRGCIDLPK